MKKKPPICQVRISSDLAETIDLLRKSFTVSTSRTGFVSYLLGLGIRMHAKLDHDISLNIRDDDRTPASK